MRKLDNVNDDDRIVVKQRATSYVGVETSYLTRNAIGIVLRGEKYIQRDDQTVKVTAGEIFFMKLGAHLIENVPTPTAPFEQLTFFFSPSQLQQVVATLESFILEESHQKSKYNDDIYSNVTKSKPSKITHNFFMAANTHYENRGFIDDKLIEKLKLTELAHYIMKYENSDFQRMLMASLDTDRATFERVIYNNILNDKSIEQLAAECRRSVTSFKKDFKAIFSMPPHQWYLRQRLNYARLLLSTTQNTITQVGMICAFPNTSHFIKLFKRQFGITPASFRSLAKSRVEGNLESLNEGVEMKDSEKVEEKEEEKVK